VNAIELKQVNKYYGNQRVLNDINISLQEGQIIGLLGPNGAGKSTLMKILTGFISPDSGEVLIKGYSVLEHPMKTKRKIGYLPEHNQLYPEMYVREYLEFVAGIFNISGDRVEEVVEETGLSPEAHKKIGHLSKGYRQRVGLAAAIIHDPDILILDEPTTGLDPNQLIEIRQLIKKLGREKTILLSTHILQEIEQMAERVLIINKGSIVADKFLKDLQDGQQQIIEVEFDIKIEKEFFNDLPHLDMVENLMDSIWCFAFNTREDMRPVLFDFARNQGLKILDMHKKNKNLEQLFKEHT
jgi:ABC-2 type transport system ATP-binding protein